MSRVAFSGERASEVAKFRQSSNVLRIENKGLEVSFEINNEVRAENL